MKNYNIPKEEQLTEDKIIKIIQDFTTIVIPQFNKKWKYYEGRHQILYKEATDEGKPNNKVVTNFVKNIVQQYSGYATGIPVSYQSDEEGFEELIDILNYNDVDAEDVEFLKQALIFGRAAEICYLDEEGKTRFTYDDVRNIIPIYSADLNNDMLYAIRLIKNKLTTEDVADIYVEVYDSTYVTIYKSTEGYHSLDLLDKHVHNFSQCPVTILKLNEEEEGVAETVFSLQDAYNNLNSGALDDWDAFVDSLLVLKGGIADDEDLAAMKKHRVLMLPNEGQDAYYLSRDTSTTNITYLLDNAETKIYELAHCPNFNDEKFGTSSGIAIRYKMMPMENVTANFMYNFKKALQRRIELISDIVAKINGEQLWRDISIQFTRNIPSDLSDIANQINGFRGLVSDETLLSQIPFVDNPEEEIEKVSKQQEKEMELAYKWTTDSEGSRER